MKHCNTIFYISYFFSLFLVIVNSEFFTALADLQSLLHTEGEIVKTLEKYLETEMQRLEKVRRLSEEFDKLYKAASHDVEKFLFNPVNAYLLVKHLTVNWKAAENLVDDHTGRTIIENITREGHLKFPDEEDLSGAASALMRLQDIYLLNSSTLACGRVAGTSPSFELKSGDCFELGRQAYNLKDYYHAVLWMQEALNRIEKKNVKSAEKADILGYMAYSAYMLGYVKLAVKLTKELLNIDPGYYNALENLQHYYDVLKKEDLHWKGNTDQITNEIDSVLFKKPKIKTYASKGKYEKLCRGESIKNTKEEKDLRCRYFTNGNSFLILQPAKEEELHLSPRIVVYHDVMSDREIELIKYLAKPKLKRAKVVDPESEDIVNYRISKSAWLDDDDHEIIRRISQRIEAITGLVTDTAESLQVLNYGIGGHYEPHYDFTTDEEDPYESLDTGNRIATWLFYMSDVAAGGATVFPSIGVQVKPIKGSAAFWYNLFQNGDGDFDTQHAACPVLAGSKWVSTKWLHERGQEFRRPCSLDPEK